MELGGAPVREVEMEPSGAAQPHLEAAGIADAPRLGHGADPQPRRGRTAEVNGRPRQRMGASPRSFSRVTEFRPSRGGSGVHEKGPCKRTRVLPYDEVEAAPCLKSKSEKSKVHVKLRGRAGVETGIGKWIPFFMPCGCASTTFEITSRVTGHGLRYV